jgi:hypothetical protein
MEPEVWHKQTETWNAHQTFISNCDSRIFGVTEKLQGLEQIFSGDCFAALSLALLGHIECQHNDEISGDLLNALFG